MRKELIPQRSNRCQSPPSQRSFASRLDRFEMGAANPLACALHWYELMCNFKERQRETIRLSDVPHLRFGL